MSETQEHIDKLDAQLHLANRARAVAVTALVMARNHAANPRRSDQVSVTSYKERLMDAQRSLAAFADELRLASESLLESLIDKDAVPSETEEA